MKFKSIIVGMMIAAPASAADIYLAQNPTGAISGADCADALAATFFNVPSNWGLGAGQIGPGATVHLCGVISTSLIVQGSGASGSPITLRWESNARLSNPAFQLNVNPAVNFQGFSFITLDGGANGVVENTQNGWGLPNQLPGAFFQSQGGSDIEIKNLLVQNGFVRSAYPASPDGGGGGGGALLFTAVSNVSIHDNVFHDNNWTLTFTTFGQNWGNLNIFNNSISRNDHGIALAGAGTGVVTGIIVRNNHFFDFENWDMSACQAHHDGLHAYGGAGGTTYSGVSIYNNTFDGDLGNCLTSYLFSESTVVMNNWLVFNNTLTLSNTPAGGPGLIAFNGSGGGTNAAVYNNTFECAGVNTGPSALFLDAASNWVVKNNLLVNCSPLIDIGLGAAAGGLDYNVYASATANIWKFGSGFYDTLASWEAASGQDSNARYTSGSAGINSSFIPQTGSIAVGAGANLTGLGIPALDFDKAGNPRPAAGVWDAGAYQYSASGPTALVPANPGGLTIR